MKVDGGREGKVKERNTTPTIKKLEESESNE